MQTDPISRFEIILRDLSFRIKQEGRKILRKYQLSKSLFDILQLIHFSSLKRLKGKDIAEKLDISRPAVSEKLRMLEQRALICREQSSTDKREVYYMMTPAGSKVIQDVISKRISYLTDLCQGQPIVDILPVLQAIYDKKHQNTP